jgi:hypothetical protein
MLLTQRLGIVTMLLVRSDPAVAVGAKADLDLSADLDRRVRTFVPGDRARCCWASLP